MRRTPVPDPAVLPLVPRLGPNIDASTDRRRLSLWLVITLAVTGAAPLTVVAGGATSGWSTTKILAIPIGYVAIVVPLWMFTNGLSRMSRLIESPGAFYTYVTQGLGRIWGTVAGGVALQAYNALQIGLTAGFGVVLSEYLKARYDTHVPWLVISAAGCSAVGVLGLLKIKWVGRLLAVLLYAEVLITVYYAVVMFAHPAGGRVSTAALNPAALISPQGAALLVIAITGYVGFEMTAIYSRETRNPARNVPLAMAGALGISVLLYFGCAFAMAVASPDIVADSTANGSQTIFVLVQPHVAPVLIDLGNMLFCSSLFAAMLAFHTTSARYGYALGLDRVLPSWMGSSVRRTGVPKAGSIAQTALCAVVLLVAFLAEWEPLVHLFFVGTVLGGFGVLILMTITSVAVIMFFARLRRQARAAVAHRRQAAPEWPLRPAGMVTDPETVSPDGIVAAGAATSAWYRWVAPGASFGVFAPILIATALSFGTLTALPEGHPGRWMLPGLYVAVAGLMVMRALYLRRNEPLVFDQIGRNLADGAGQGPAGVPVGVA
jgi:amino acid transporter